MLNDIVFLLVLAPITSLMLFIGFARRHQAHLRTIKEIISFWAWPYPPRRMVIVREIDGKIRTFYDDEVEIIKSRGKYMVKTVYGDQYITRFDPDKIGDVVSLYDCRNARGHPSPMGLATRWVISAAFMVFLVYAAMVTVWFPEPEVVSRGEYLVVKPPEINPWVALPITMVFTAVITWFVVNIMRFSDRTTVYTNYVALSIEPPYQELFPAVAPDTTLHPSEVLKSLGRELRIVVPDAVKSVIEKIKERVGSEELAASILSKLSMVDVWRKAYASLAEEGLYLRKAGETAAALRLKIMSPRIRISVTLAALLVGVIIGFVAGFSFGQVWAVAPAPPMNATAATTALTPSITPAKQPPPPMHVNTSTPAITPPKPPPPPKP